MKILKINMKIKIIKKNDYGFQTRVKANNFFLELMS